MLFLTRDVGQGGVCFKAPQGAVPLHGSHPTAQDPGREVHQLLSLRLQLFIRGSEKSLLRGAADPLAS